MLQTPNTIEKALHHNGLSQFCSPAELEKFTALTELLIEANARLNLTAITDPVEIAVKHIADSLLAARLIPSGASVIDIGCGGGFPTLPLAIARPDCTFTALDSTAKKLTFVTEATATLALGNIKTIAARAEEFANTARTGENVPRETFDVAIARGVAALPALCEICLPFVTVGGVFIAMKGSGASAELDNATNAIKTLGAAVEKVDSPSLLALDGTTMTRALIVIKKIKPTPKSYPRTWAQIIKKPL